MLSSGSSAPDLRFGPYRVERELGRGSSAVVYEVVHQVTGDHFALKHLVGSEDPAELKREFRIARSLRHPNLVQLHELAQVDGSLFFTMELIRGPELSPEACRGVGRREVLRGLALALDHLHAAAFVHRDLKPQNVLVADGRAVLVDLGLARPLTAAPTAVFSGSPLYAAPERFGGRPASPASDWYSFGVLLWELAAGDLPADLLPSRLDGRAARVPPDLDVDGAPVSALVTSLLDEDPRRRGGLEEVLAALGGEAPRRSSRRLVGRAAEERRLARELDRPGVVVVVGPAGVGKSALVRQALRSRTGRVVRVRCHPADAVPISALDALWAELVPGVPPPASLGELGAGLARALSEAPGAVVSIDDAQWADDDSVRVLAGLGGLGEATFVYTVRGGLADLPAPLRTDRVLELPPLSAASATALLAELCPACPAERLVALSEVAQGRPLWIELAAAWAVGPDEPPADVGDLLRTLVTGEHGDRLGLLAAHPTDLPLEVLEAAGTPFVGPGWELVDAGLVGVRRTERGGWALEVRHAAVAENVLAGASDDTRRRWHTRLARAFLTCGADADAVFTHLLAAGLTDEARVHALAAADRLAATSAFHRAAERYRWVVHHGAPPDRDRALRGLADVLGRGGEGAQAGEVWAALAAEAPDPAAARDLRRRAAEQYLRAGDEVRGRALLDVVLRDVGLWMPRSRLARILLSGWQRASLHVAPALALLSPSTRLRSESLREQLDAAWSAGLGLNLVDVVASAVAQGHYTRLAVAFGGAGELARARGVEYSFRMLLGGAGADAVGERLRAELTERSASLGPYDASMVALSWCAGDVFRGHLPGVVERALAAKRGFARELAARSWEIANCEMYAGWAGLEAPDPVPAADQLAEALCRSTSSGDVAYRRCVVAGPASAGWLLRGRGDELQHLLDDAPLATDGFELPHFFEWMARHRLALARGQWAEAQARADRVWPAVRGSGMLHLGWLRTQLVAMRAQAALAGAGDPRELDRAVDALRAQAGWLGPAWAGVLAGLRAPSSSRALALESAAAPFAERRFATTARAVAHQAWRAGGRGERWAVPDADSLADALVGPLP